MPGAPAVRGCSSRSAARSRWSDLLHGIIIQSGNDASVALAEHIAGSEDAFADMMNTTAQKLGLTNSHFMDATGLPNLDHYSSARDMAVLARAIIYGELSHYAIYAQKEFLWNNIKQPNRNLLLWRDKTVDGLKTGHTDEAGYCLVASAVRDGQRMIAVVFGTNSEQARAAETQKLLTYGFRFFESRNFYKKGTELTKGLVWKGSEHEVKAGLAEDLTMTLPRGQMQKLQASMVLEPQLMAPIQQGQVIGKVEVKLDDKVIRSADLVALNAVEEGGFFRRLWIASACSSTVCSTDRPAPARSRGQRAPVPADHGSAAAMTDTLTFNPENRIPLRALSDQGDRRRRRRFLRPGRGNHPAPRAGSRRRDPGGP